MTVSPERIISSPVPSGTAVQRLDQYLSSRFSYLSRTSWQREVACGRLLVNGEPVIVPGRKVRPGDMITYMPPDYSEPDVDPSYEVLFEDECLIAVNKSGNIPVHPSGVFFNNTLVMVLERDTGTRLFPVHRLDRETSGAILFAKDPGTASAVQKNFGSFSKSYRAVVRGIPESEEFSVRVPIGPARSSVVRKKREAYPGAAEEAFTGFRVISVSGDFSFVEALPVTGRMHQIRVHLWYAGLPIVGDKLYGGDEKVYLEYVENGLTESVIRRAGFRRCALHSYSIAFVHPRKDERVNITAPLPDDIKKLAIGMGLCIDYNRISRQVCGPEE